MWTFNISFLYFHFIVVIPFLETWPHCIKLSIVTSRIIPASWTFTTTTYRPRVFEGDIDITVGSWAISIREVLKIKSVKNSIPTEALILSDFFSPPSLLQPHLRASFTTWWQFLCTLIYLSNIHLWLEWLQRTTICPNMPAKRTEGLRCLEENMKCLSELWIPSVAFELA